MENFFPLIWFPLIDRNKQIIFAIIAKIICFFGFCFLAVNSIYSYNFYGGKKGTVN